MKHINIALEDEAYEALLRRKGAQTWRAFLASVAEAPAQTWESYAAKALASNAELAAQKAREEMNSEETEWTARWRAAGSDEERALLRAEAKEKGFIRGDAFG